MINPFNIQGRCKDANGNYIEKGEWYFHPDLGYIRFVREWKSAKSLRAYSWEIEHSNGNNLTYYLTINKFNISRCIKVGKFALDNCVEDARWARKRIEELEKLAGKGERKEPEVDENHNYRDYGSI